MKKEAIIDRIFRLSSFDKKTGCLMWLGYKCKKSYGRIQLDGKSQMAHRISFELFVKKIPKGYEVDHLCRVRDCINPQHLESVTLRENRKRAGNYRVLHTTKCKKGHDLTPDNIRIITYKKEGRKWRICDKCRYKYNKERWLKFRK